MVTGARMEWIARASPGLKARIAGILYLLAVVTAVFGEFIVPGKLGPAAVFIPVTSYIVATLILYDIFRKVNGSVALLAASFGVVGLVLEALPLNPRGVNIAMVFHGFYCLLIGYLTVRSSFLPRIPGVLMAFAGLVWLMYLSPPLERYLSPYNTAFGLFGEASLMLWLLVMGVNNQRWKEQTRATEVQPD